MNPQFQFSLKGVLVATAMFAVLAWIASLVWTSHRPPSGVMLVVTPMLCLILFRLWAFSRN
jgi:hypothetical protein